MGKLPSKLHLPNHFSEESLRLFQQHEIKDLVSIFQKLKSSNSLEKPKNIGLTEEQFAEYFSYPGALRKQIFQVFDRNTDGFIDEEEFIRGLAMCCRGPIDEKLTFVFSMCDLNKDSFVDRDELKLVLSSTAFSSFALLQAVALEEGKISEEHKIKSSKEFDEEVDDMVEQAFQSSDGNGDSLLSFDEFVKWLLDTPEILNIIYSVFEFRNHVEVADVKEELKQRRRTLRHLELTVQETERSSRPNISPKEALYTTPFLSNVEAQVFQGSGTISKQALAKERTPTKEDQVKQLKAKDETLYALIETIIDKEEAEWQLSRLQSENGVLCDRIEVLLRDNKMLKNKIKLQGRK
jgi:Ca2+-binding EF-hand superfamily protein